MRKTTKRTGPLSTEHIQQTTQKGNKTIPEMAAYSPFSGKNERKKYIHPGNTVVKIMYTIRTREFL
jgi:hypothetical protein